MKHSDQGITRTQRGEEQPIDKDRAQAAHKMGEVESPPRQETCKDRETAITRSGDSTKHE